MSKGGTLLIRSLSGAVLLAVVLLTVLLSEYTFLLLMGLIGVGTLYEYQRLVTKSGADPQRGYGMVAGIFILVLNFMVARGSVPALCLIWLLVVGMLFFIIELYRKREHPLQNIAVSLAGLFYTFIPVSVLCYFAFPGMGAYTPWIVLSYIFTVWANDVGAYLVGSVLGRHPLFPRISPKKSWEGFIGGVIAAVVFSAYMGHHLGMNEWVWGGFGLVVAVSGVYGDLVESLFKRSVGVKDSGSIMPGHGGFLDRFDALLLSVPFVFIYFIIFAA